ncbi:MAG: hypothetical protein WC848_06525 [Parcubacteria group bacterium]|jgi:hypothetical protein
MPTKKFKASILVVTMMILGIMLVTALSVSLVSIKDRQASMGESKSTQAFQNAQSGVELVMRQITEGGHSTVGDICGTAAFMDTAGVGYDIVLKKEDDSDLSCTTDALSPISEIASIKSIGTGSGDQRAIEAAVAATSLTWTNLPLETAAGWVNYNTGHQVAQYAIDSSTGLVYLRGLVVHKTGASVTAATGVFATIPTSNCRPLKRLTFPAWASIGGAYTAGRIDILPNGNLRQEAANNGFATLDGIVFSTD